jgi:addiction module HigA family antidote
MIMHSPPHPGQILKELYLEPLNLSITETAHALNITRQSLSEFINGRNGVSSTMAWRLAKAFKTSPVLWLNLQTQYDLWNSKNNDFGDIICLVA